MSKIFASRLFWPVVMLLVLFAINLIAFPGFFSIVVKDGHLFGSLVDIVRNGAPTLIIAVGMTLVIATRGIDVGAKAEIQKLVVNLAENGMSVIFISAELEEVLRLSHRIAIMRDRRLVADIDNDDVSVDSLLAIIADGSVADQAAGRPASTDLTGATT